MKNIIAYLQDLGFSEIEAKLYVTLLKKGPLSVKEITDQLGIQRTRAYPYVERLLEKGVIIASSASRKKLSASNPEHLRMLVEQKVTAVTQLKDSFSEIVKEINGTVSSSTINNSFDVLDMLEDFINEEFSILYEGRCITLNHLSKAVNSHIEKVFTHPLLESEKHKLFKLKGSQLYLQGRLLSFIGQSSTIVAEMQQITNELFSLSQIAKLPYLSAYANILFSDAYYIAGGYSKDNFMKDFYFKSIKYSNEALSLFDKKDFNRIIAIRNIAGSAINLKDKQTFLAIRSTAEQFLNNQPFENHIYALHLAGTIARGNAFFHLPDPFELKEKSIKHFGISLKGSGAFEVSDIRTEVETLSLMGSNEKSYMKSLATKGAILADQDNLTRYKNYFDKIMPTL